MGFARKLHAVSGIVRRFENVKLIARRHVVAQDSICGTRGSLGNIGKLSSEAFGVLVPVKCCIYD